MVLIGYRRERPDCMMWPLGPALLVGTIDHIPCNLGRPSGDLGTEQIGYCRERADCRMWPLGPALLIGTIGHVSCDLRRPSGKSERLNDYNASKKSRENEHIIHICIQEAGSNGAVRHRKMLKVKFTLFSFVSHTKRTGWLLPGTNGLQDVAVRSGLVGRNDRPCPLRSAKT